MNDEATIRILLVTLSPLSSAHARYICENIQCVLASLSPWKLYMPMQGGAQETLASHLTSYGACCIYCLSMLRKLQGQTAHEDIEDYWKYIWSKALHDEARNRKHLSDSLIQHLTLLYKPLM